MKKEFIDKLRAFKTEVVALKREVGGLSTERVSKKKLMVSAEAIASKWVEEMRSPLEHKFKLDKQVIEHTSGHLKQLHVLSRPNNLKKSYVLCLNAILKDYDNKFILPIQQSAENVAEIFDLQKILPGLANSDESEYLKEAISCAERRFYKAAIVMG